MQTIYKQKSLLFSLLFLLIPIVSIANSPYRERVYLQTDKQSYLAGELLWLKFYLTNEDGIPESLSKIGYVEIITEDATPVVQLKLELTKGIGEGSIELPTSLPNGYYRMIGYTRYMQNEDAAIYFEKQIAVINTFKVNENIVVDSTHQIASYTPTSNNITITSDRTSYPKRNQGEIKLQSIPTNIHSLGVSISGEELLPGNPTSQIQSWAQNLSTLPNLNFEAKKILEYEGHIISGTIEPIGGTLPQDLSNIHPYIAFPGDAVRLYDGKIETGNQVSFIAKGIKGTHEIVSSSFSSSDVRINIESPFSSHSPKEAPVFKLNPNWKEKLEKRSVGLQILHTYMADSLNNLEPALPFFRWETHNSYILDEYTRFTRMDELFIEFIPSASFRKLENKRSLSVINEDKTRFSQGNTLVLLDGIPILDHDFILNYSPLLVKRIDIYRGLYIIGKNIFDGVVTFSTYEHNYPGWLADESTQLLNYEGPVATRPFYAPSYQENKEENKYTPDYRHTLLWEPNLQTQESSSITIPFSTSDITGNFTVTVEGITTDGKPVYGTAYFSVEE